MRKTILISTTGVCLLLLTLSVSANNVPKTDNNGAVATKADIMISTVHSFLRAQDYEKALSIAEELAETYANYSDGWMILGYCRTLNKKFTESNEAYEVALSIGADKKEVYGRMAYNYVKIKDWANARTKYQAVIKIDDTDGEALVQLAYLEEKLKNLNDAALYYGKALNVMPRNTKVIGAMARVEDKRGNKDEARMWLVRGLKIEPENKQFLQRYSSILLNEQKQEEALPYVEKLVAIDPENASAQRNLGVAYYGLGRKKEAIKAFERVREYGGKMNGLYGPLAEAYRSIGQKSKALAIIKEGLQEEDQMAWLYCLYGKHLEDGKNFDGAIAMFNKAIELQEKPWGDYAKKQIARQVQLKKRAELMAAQAGSNK